MDNSKDSAMLRVPSNFNSMVYDFINDLTATFPEYAFLWKRWLNPEMPMAEQEELFLFFTKVFPERFFDILYQNDDIFAKDSVANTIFLPNVDFKILFHCGNITENTKKAIWKYLQLILISVLNSVQNKKTFGDAANLFEGFEENVIQEKLNETIEGISEFFKTLGSDRKSAQHSSSSEKEEGQSNENAEFNPEEMFEKMMNESPFGGDGNGPFGGNKTEGMPNAEELNEHLRGLFDGKIGSLAKEMAEEISEDMKEMFDQGDMNDVRSTQDILKKMIKNPKKMMDLMKNIGSKLQNKMKSGEISEEEIMKEAGELMGKMKGMTGGQGGFADIMKNMAQGLAGGKAKFNMGAFNRMEKQMSTKERMLSKLEQKRQGKAESEEKVKYSLNTTTIPNNYVFKLDEEDIQEKSAMKETSTDIDALVNEINSAGQAKTGTKSSKKKKGKK